MEPELQSREDFLSTTLTSEMFSARVWHGCCTLNLVTVRDLYDVMNEFTQDHQKVFGNRSRKEIRKIFEKNNINLGEEKIVLSEGKKIIMGRPLGVN